MGSLADVICGRLLGRGTIWFCIAMEDGPFIGGIAGFSQDSYQIADDLMLVFPGDAFNGRDDTIFIGVRYLVGPNVPIR